MKLFVCIFFSTLFVELAERGLVFKDKENVKETIGSFIPLQLVGMLVGHLFK